MAIVGEAHIIVRAITNKVPSDIKNGFKGANGIASAAGVEVADSFARGFQKNDPLKRAFEGLSGATESARRTFDALIVSSYTLGPALGQLVGGISALIGALGGLAGMAAAVIPSLAALGGAFSALIQAAGTLKLAFSGVSAAISAGQKQMGSSSGGGVKKLEKDLTSFTRRIADARRRLRRVLEDNSDKIYDANRKLIQAQVELIRIEQENADKIVEAKKKVEEAQLSLNEAYEAGYEQIQQMNFDAEDAALAEKRAALELDKARETLRRTQDLPPNSRARREAELAYAQADLNYRRAVDTNKDMAKEKEKLDAVGVEGTDAVIRAQKDLQDAQDDVIKAEKDATDDRVEAYDRITEARENLAEVEKKAAQDEKDARRDLKRAIEDLEKARNQADASGAASANAYQTALNKLSPEAQDFVKFMVEEFIPSLDKLKAAAGREFFPKLITAMRTIKDDLFPSLVPLLETTGGKLGQIAIKIANFITSDEALGKIKTVWQNNDKLIEHFGNIAVSALRAVLDILVAIGPLTEKFVGWLDESAKSIADFISGKSVPGADGKSPLEKFFNQSGRIAAKFGKIFGNVFRGLNQIILGLMEKGSGGWILLNWFDNITKKFEDFTKSNPGRIREYFQNVAENAIKILEATGPFVGLLIRLGERASIGEFADSMKGLVPTIESIANKFTDAGPALAEFLASAVKFIDITTDSGAIEQFWKTLTAVADTLIELFSNPTIQKGFVLFASLAATLVALRTAWNVLKIPILAVMNIFTSLGPPLLSVVGWFSNLAGAVGGFGKILPAVVFNFKAFFALFGGIVGTVGLVVAAVAGLVAIFVAMWRESETFRKALKKLWDTISGKVLKVFEDLKKKVDDALEPLGGLEGVIETLKVVFKGLGDFIGTYVIPVIEFIVGLLIDTLGNAIGFIIDYTGVLIKAWKFAWDAVWAAVEFVVTWFRDTAWPIISGIIDKIEEGFNIAKKAISKAWDDIQDAIKPVVTWFRDTAWPIIDTVIDNVVEAFKTAKRTLDTIWTNIQDRVQTAWDFITGLLKKIWNPFENKLNSVWGTIQTTIGKIKTKIETWIGNISGIVSGVWDGMYSGITSIWGKIKSWWNANIAGKGFTIPGIPGIWDGIDATIPQLAEGGVIQPRSGGTLALIGEAGRPERVEPIDSDGLSQRDRAIIAQLSGAGGSGMTINVFPSEGMDERELAAMIGRELAFQMSKGA